ncbi:MAG TPA: hypothetical protein VLL95_01450, partial [Phnomibacter sp.]|nr:hypothetical protein [Phnomibacter sp.]
MAVQPAPVKIDSLSIVPGSFVIAGYDSSWYSLDAARSVLFWKRTPATDSVSIQYRVFNFSL